MPDHPPSTRFSSRTPHGLRDSAHLGRPYLPNFGPKPYIGPTSRYMVPKVRDKTEKKQHPSKSEPKPGGRWLRRRASRGFLLLHCKQSLPRCSSKGSKRQTDVFLGENTPPPGFLKRWALFCSLICFFVSLHRLSNSTDHARQD